MNQPSPANVLAARMAAGMTQTQAAATVHATLRAWASWESRTPHARAMHPGLFELFLIKTGQRAAE